MQNGMNQTERTFIVVKPDGVQRCLVYKIMKKFEQRGYKLVAIKMIQATTEKLEEVGRTDYSLSLRVLSLFHLVLSRCDRI